MIHKQVIALTKGVRVSMCGKALIGVACSATCLELFASFAKSSRAKQQLVLYGD